MAARDSVLVTGAYGLVGRPVVQRLVADGFPVVATAHRTTKPALPSDVDVRSVDLTKPADVGALFADVAPSVIVHLAAVIPPLCYANRALSRAVNVDATAALGARRGGNVVAALVRARLQHGGVRQPEPPPVHRLTHP